MCIVIKLGFDKHKNSAAKFQKWIGVRFERGLSAYLATRESAR